MSTLYITEYTNMTWIDLTPFPAPALPPNAEQSVSIAGTSAQSAPMHANTVLIQVNTDAACSLAFGSSPTAVTAAHRLSAGETRFYGINPGTVIAVIANT